MTKEQLKGLLLIFTGFLLSCNGGRIDAEFSDDELEWLVYKKSDTLHFTSENQDTITTFIKFIADASQVSKRYPIEAELALTKTSGNELFRILLLKDEQNFNKYIRLGNVYRKPGKPKDSIMANGHVYNNVYKLDQDTSKPENKIWQVFYNKDQGFVKFITADQDSFALVPPAPKNPS